MKKLFTIIFIFVFNQAFASSSSLHDGVLSVSALHPKKLKWTFDGFFGSIDKASAQRGFQVYKEICSSCHGLKLVAYRNLEDIGFAPEEVKFIASQYLVQDGPDDEGEMFERPGLPSDRFVSPYTNDNQARASNGGALPPDLSLIIKARHDGANYVYSLLTGYKKAPDEFPLVEGKNYNPYFEGRQIAMPEPITDDGQVEYGDGTYATKEQMIIDVVNFLQYAAEPETEKRKKMGVRTMIFLLALFAILLAAKKAVWRDVK
ncbi:MAG TPA: cytochrome c1 [Rickettsiales bacterium]|nr:cytochrome c1 [Rickettsiales bacterium]